MVYRNTRGNYKNGRSHFNNQSNGQQNNNNNHGAYHPNLGTVNPSNSNYQVNQHHQSQGSGSVRGRGKWNNNYYYNNNGNNPLNHQQHQSNTSQPNINTTSLQNVNNFPPPSLNKDNDSNNNMGVETSQDKVARHMHERTLYVLANAIGHQVKVDTASGDAFKGFFHTATADADLSVALQLTRELGKDGKECDIVGSKDGLMLFMAKDVESIEIEGLELDFAIQREPRRQGFMTDTSISGNVEVRERELVSWVPDENIPDTSNLDADNPFIDANGKWDQFAANKALYNVQSTYDELIYTTKINKDAPNYKEIEKKAEQIANEILSKSSNNPHVNEERNLDVNNDISEEDKYSSVARSIKEGKYVAPLLKQKYLNSLASKGININDINQAKKVDEITKDNKDDTVNQQQQNSKVSSVNVTSSTTTTSTTNSTTNTNASNTTNTTNTANNTTNPTKAETLSSKLNKANTISSISNKLSAPTTPNNPSAESISTSNSNSTPAKSNKERFLEAMALRDKSLRLALAAEKELPPPPPPKKVVPGQPISAKKADAILQLFSATKALSKPTQKKLFGEPRPTKPIEQELMGTFRQFVSTEKERVKLGQQAKIKKDKDGKVAELLKFSKTFKLNTPVPDNVKDIINLSKRHKEEKESTKTKEKEGLPTIQEEETKVEAPKPKLNVKAPEFKPNPSAKPFNPMTSEAKKEINVFFTEGKPEIKQDIYEFQYSAIETKVYNDPSTQAPTWPTEGKPYKQHFIADMLTFHAMQPNYPQQPSSQQQHPPQMQHPPQPQPQGYYGYRYPTNQMGYPPHVIGMMPPQPMPYMPYPYPYNNQPMYPHPTSGPHYNGMPPQSMAPQQQQQSQQQQQQSHSNPSQGQGQSQGANQSQIQAQASPQTQAQMQIPAQSTNQTQDQTQNRSQALVPASGQNSTTSEATNHSNSQGSPYQHPSPSVPNNYQPPPPYTQRLPHPNQSPNPNSNPHGHGPPPPLPHSLPHGMIHPIPCMPYPPPPNFHPMPNHLNPHMPPPHPPHPGPYYPMPPPQHYQPPQPHHQHHPNANYHNSNSYGRKGKRNNHNHNQNQHHYERSSPTRSHTSSNRGSSPRG